MTQKRMNELLSRLEPKIRNRFRQIVQRARDERTVAELEAALEGGRAADVVDEFERIIAGLASSTEDAYAVVAAEVAKSIAKKLDAIVSFDATNVRAVDALRANRLRMVRELTETQRAAFTESLAVGTKAGLNPREQAKAFRDAIGLTDSQARWVTSYRGRLRSLDRKALGMELRDKRFDATTVRAMESGKPLTDAQVDRMVERYRQRAVKYRAEVVARTEALRAAHEAQDEAHRQAIEAGHIDEVRVQRKWVAARDGRTRDSHRRMNGQLRRMDENFTSGSGYPLKYPGDPGAPASETAQCRCAVTVRILPEGEVAQSQDPPDTPDQKKPAGPEVPDGFRVPTGAKVVDGLPDRASIKAREVYVVPVDQLRGRVVALGQVESEKRLDRIRQGWDKGTKLDPIRLVMGADGQLLVEDGRHRLTVAAERGQSVLVRLGRGTSENAEVLNLPWPVAKAA